MEPLPTIIPITRVRLLASDADEAVQAFLNGGAASNPRPPRGIDPAVVSLHVLQALKPDSGFGLFMRALELVRFYERVDTLPVFLAAMNGKEMEANQVRRSAYAVQAAADFAVDEPLAKAVDYFDKTLAPKGKEPPEFSLLLDTAVALSPSGAGIDAVGAAIARELRLAEPERDRDEIGFNRYHSLNAVERNDLKSARARAAAKKLLLEKTEDARHDELVRVYLGRSPMSDETTEVWAARMLRLKAMAGAQPKVCAAFARGLDRVLGEMPAEKAGYWIIRACQAIVYLQGTVSEEHLKLWNEAKGGALNFLWDDPEPSPLGEPSDFPLGQ